MLKISAFYHGKQKSFVPKTIWGMLVIKTIKSKVSDFLNSNTRFCLLLYSSWIFYIFCSNEDFANELILSANVTMAIAEQVIEKMMQTLTGIEKISNDSSVVDLSLSLILPEHPWTVEYALIGSAYSLAVMKSWTRSIDSRNWTDVSITFRFDYITYTAHPREIVPRGDPLFYLMYVDVF